MPLQHICQNNRNSLDGVYSERSNPLKGTYSFSVEGLSLLFFVQIMYLYTITSILFSFHASELYVISPTKTQDQVNNLSLHITGTLPLF